MGREIVYCWKCATRLQGSDFDARKAYRYGDKVSCAGCIDELICDLSAEEQEAILNPADAPRKGSSSRVDAVPPSGGTTASRRATGPIPKARTGTTGRVPVAGSTRKITRSIPKVAPPPGDEEAEGAQPAGGSKKKILLIAGGGGALLLIAVVAIVLMLPGDKKSKDGGNVVAPPVSKTPDKPKEGGKEQAARNALMEAITFQKNHPEDFGGQIIRFRDAEKASDGTTLAGEPATQITLVLAKVQKAIAALEQEAEGHFKNRDLNLAVDTWQKNKDKHDIPEWKDEVQRKIELIRGIAAERFRNIREKYADPAYRTNADAVAEDRKDAERLGAEFKEELEKLVKGEAPATPDAPKKPGETAKPPATPAAPVLKFSPEMKSFLPAWEKAMGLAFNREYESALVELNKGAKEIDADEVRKAASEDADLLRSVAAGVPEIFKALAETPRAVLTIEYQHAPGEWKKVPGRIVKVEATRLEFKPEPLKDAKDPKAAPKEQPAILVEFADLSAASIAELFKARKKKIEKNETATLAHLCLLEGATEAAKAFTSGLKIPERLAYWAPQAKEKAPKPASREFEARNLFHQVEAEWREIEKWGSAIDKCKTLLNDYAVTAFVRRYQTPIARRAGTGREYTLVASQLKANGDSNTFRLVKGEEPAWISTKEIDFQESLFNYIHVDFYALPNQAYRAWSYVGGCCQEVFAGSFQATEATVSHKGKAAPIDPGVPLAAPLPIPGGLKKKHDDHKPKGAKDHPKQAARWEWISIPLPKTYSEPGAKAIRILTDQAGFGVKYVIVSSGRDKAPNDQTAKELAKEVAAASSALPKVTGAGAPKDWLVVGPFDANLGMEYGPEKEITLDEGYKGKGGGAQKWRAAAAAVSGPTATFDWDKNKIFNPKDNVSAYALIHVKAPAAMDATLIISHDDGARVWVQGQDVYTTDKAVAAKDEAKRKIRLDEGWNRVLVKVKNATAAYGFSLRIVGGDNKPIEGMEYHPYGDELQPQ